jgi:hypothetical protein
MSGRRQSLTRLRSPYLRRLTLLCDRITDRETYPFNLPWLTDSFALDFTAPVTIIIGENGTGKSTLVEAIAALAGYDEAGGARAIAPSPRRQVDLLRFLHGLALTVLWPRRLRVQADPASSAG